MTKEQFLKDINPWGSHRTLLWEALEATKGNTFPILEMGCGDGSTPFLKQYAQDTGRHLVSMDSNKQWAAKYGARWTEDWHYLEWFTGQRYSVVLCDESPGEHRAVTLQLFSSYPIHFEIIVIHDSEPVGWNASDYKVRPLFKKFEYYKDDIPSEKGAPWTTALSNNFDVTTWQI